MKIKRIICLVLALVLVTALVPVSAGAAVSTVNVSDHGIGDLQRAAGNDGKDAESEPVTYYDPVSDEEKICDNYALVTSGTREMKNGIYVVSGSVSATSRITVSGRVTLIISDGAILEAKNGINVASGQSLTIYGQIGCLGKLTAAASSKLAGIGGGNHEDCGTIVINGGIISATGGKYGAGIGGGNCGKGGSVTINGGFVEATGGSEGAGIGGGDEDPGEYVLITGGNVTATGGEWAAGIGGGGVHGADPGGSISSSNHGGKSGTVVIKGGAVTAVGGSHAAGIGGGNHADCDSVTIEDGVVTAYCSGKWGAGIGGGNCGSGGDIVITGGTIEATAGTSENSIKPEAIGRGDEGASFGSLTLYRCMRVKVAGVPISVSERLGSCRAVGKKTVLIECCREHLYESSICKYCGMIRSVVPLDNAMTTGFNTDNAATVYYAGEPYRLIGFNGEGVAGKAGTITLLSSNIRGYCRFSKSNNGEYMYSVLKTKTDAAAGRLSSYERAAVSERTLVSGTYAGLNTDCVSGPEVKKAVMWPLSIKEAVSLPRNIGTGNLEHPDWANSFWWLRSPDYYGNDGAYVGYLGQIELYGDYASREFGIRPAMYLDTSYILFASAAVGGKAGTVGKLGKVAENKSGEWKLTVFDRAYEDFSVREVNFASRVLSFKYSNANAGDNEMISAILVNKYGRIKYYGKICAAVSGENIPASIAVDVTLRDGDTVYIFNEQCNGDKNTDRASALIKTVGFSIDEPDYGDCNGDGVVNGQDLIRLRKYLNGVPNTELSKGADATGDGAVNGQDLVRLRKYLLSEDPSILGPQ